MIVSTIDGAPPPDNRRPFLLMNFLIISAASGEFCRLFWHDYPVRDAFPHSHFFVWTEALFRPGKVKDPLCYAALAAGIALLSAIAHGLGLLPNLRGRRARNLALFLDSPRKLFSYLLSLWVAVVLLCPLAAAAFKLARYRFIGSPGGRVESVPFVLADAWLELKRPNSLSRETVNDLSTLFSCWAVFFVARYFFLESAAGIDAGKPLLDTLEF